jgi:hypothetical protein
VHTVIEGDSLRIIALKYYGRGHQDDWQVIYEANRATIGDNPYLLTPGSILEIPSQGGSPTFTAPLLKGAGCLAALLLPLTLLVFNAWKHFRTFGNWNPLPFLSGSGVTYPGDSRFLALSALLFLFLALAIMVVANNLSRPDTILGTYLAGNPSIAAGFSYLLAGGVVFLGWFALEQLFAATSNAIEYRPFIARELMPMGIALLAVVVFLAIGMRVLAQAEPRR